MLFLAHPIIDITMEAARERRGWRQREAEQHLDLQLSGMSRLTGIDFSKFDLDQPLPADLTTNGHQSSLAKWIGKTPRSMPAELQPARAASTSPAPPTTSPA